MRLQRDVREHLLLQLGRGRLGCFCGLDSVQMFSVHVCVSVSIPRVLEWPWLVVGMECNYLRPREATQAQRTHLLPSAGGYSPHVSPLSSTFGLRWWYSITFMTGHS